jgi:hypothetical protein
MYSGRLFLKMDAALSVEILVMMYRIAWYHITEKSNFLFLLKFIFKPYENFQSHLRCHEHWPDKSGRSVSYTSLHSPVYEKL